MKKILIFLICSFLLISFSAIGYHFVSANERVDELKDTISEQIKKEQYFSSYGYTIDNPNIIINPYGISPLTALIFFETPKRVSVTATIVGKTLDTTYSNTFNSSKKHCIPIYGLYADYNNKIVLSYDNVEKEIFIQTNPLPKDFQVNLLSSNNGITFVNDNVYSYAVDKNNEIRWFFLKNYFGKISRLANGHFLLADDNLDLSQYSRYLLEIDLLGKVYNQYYIEDGYFGSYIENKSSFLILSKNLLQIDKQSGFILKKVKLDYLYDSLNYNSETNMLELGGVQNLIINKDTLEKRKVDYSFDDNKMFISSNFYVNQEEFKIVKGIKFSSHHKTVESSKKILLIGYKKIDKSYLKYNIKISKTDDYLKISGNFQESDEVYIILDQFLNKKIYKINNNLLIINNVDLYNKYSIYIQINDTIYKTNQYVNF